MYLVITPESLDLSPGGEVILRHRTWDDYEAILKSRQDRAAVKVRFDASTQEIRLMAPMPGHGKRSKTLSDLVTALLRFKNLDWEGFDPITLKQLKQKGLEPDTCFYIANRQAILGKERIDLAVDPPPDLAIEVDLTSFTSPDDYQKIGVPELWIYRQALRIYVFDGQQYHERDRSPTFPDIPVIQLIPKYVERAWTAGSSVALREFDTELSRLA
ncbi:MAG: Uma2 family endonuclease [Leptolyngbya sp. SIO4C1]|nr:Uma2 family endonuclease [Leptolyngbya sp. SIO4C1]